MRTMLPMKYFSLLILSALFFLAPLKTDAAEEKIVIASRETHEKCLDLAEGEKLPYRFSSSATVNFNIHYHEGKDVRYLEQQRSILSFEGNITAPHAGEYCLMWKNRTWDDAALHYETR